MLDEQDAPVHIEDYDANWPSSFEAERRILCEVLRPWMDGSIEHVGSTAVPGLRAKPVIDIMVGVRSLEESKPAIAALEQLSYGYFPYRPDVMHWFCKPSPSFRTHHLHLIPFAGNLWTERLAFRDYLRTHPDTASEYAARKERLAQQHRFDREAYTEAKGPFIRQVLALSAVASASPAK